jgi:hypothetical protein
LYVHQGRGPAEDLEEPQGDAGRRRWSWSQAKAFGPLPSAVARSVSQDADVVAYPDSEDADGLLGLSASCCVPPTRRREWFAIS